MPRDFNNLKEWIERMCKEANLPVYKLANRAGISRASIYAWMADRHRPDTETLMRISQALAQSTGKEAATIFADGCSHYTIRTEGRPFGDKQALQSVRAR